MNPALLIAIIQTILTAAPEIIGEIEKLIGDLKTPAPPGPLTPVVTADMDSLEKQLEAPPKAK